MVNCSVVGCKSRSEQKYENLTFHTFPLDDDVRSAWITATGRQDWKPAKYSRICSKHFEEHFFHKTQKKVYLNKFSMPTLFVHNVTLCLKSLEELQPSTSKQCEPMDVETHTVMQHATSEEMDMFQKKYSPGIATMEDATLSPQKGKLVKELKRKTILAESRKKKIATLRSKTQRLQKKNSELVTVIKELKRKHYLNHESADLLSLHCSKSTDSLSEEIFEECSSDKPEIDAQPADNMPKLLMCRGCFATEIRLFDLESMGLKAVFDELVGKTRVVEPAHCLCSCCAALLVKFTDFRAKCRRAETLLQELRDLNMLNSSIVKSVDRPHYKLTLNMSTSSPVFIEIYGGEFREDKVKIKAEYESENKSVDEIEIESKVKVEIKSEVEVDNKSEDELEIQLEEEEINKPTLNIEYNSNVVQSVVYLKKDDAEISKEYCVDYLGKDDTEFDKIKQYEIEQNVDNVGIINKNVFSKSIQMERSPKIMTDVDLYETEYNMKDVAEISKDESCVDYLEENDTEIVKIEQHNDYEANTNKTEQTADDIGINSKKVSSKSTQLKKSLKKISNTSPLYKKKYNMEMPALTKDGHVLPVQASKSNKLGTAYNHIVTEHQDDRMAPRNQSLPMLLVVPLESASSTSAAPIAEPPTLVAPKTKAQKQRITALKTMETDEQTPSTSSTSMETEDIVPSTSAVPFVVPHTTSTARTNAQRQREYRLRRALTRTPEQVRAFAKAAAERQRRFKLRKSANIALTSGTSESPASTSCSVVERTSVPVVAERTSVPLTNAQRQRAFRQRRAASSRTDVQPNTSSTQTAIQLEQST